ncbi:MAG TPA: hypothetical protein VM241_00375 [Candidatus Thermoplasmatota archaeon]|nr:hypothetical protein [Candidatus Thermoplasmatota archaeon]
MKLRLLVPLALVLAGCAGKSAPATGGDAAQVTVAATGHLPLGSSAPPGATAGVAAPPQGAQAPPGGDAPAAPAPGSEGTAASPPSSAPASPAATSTPTTTATATSTATSGLPTGLPPPPTPTTTSVPTTPTSTPTAPAGTTTPPLPGPPLPILRSCTVALTGLHGLAPIPAYSGACAPATFVSSTGAAFTHVAVQVTQAATLLPAAVLVQVKDAGGNVIATATGLGALQVTVPTAQVPNTPSLGLSAAVALTGVFTDYAATLAFTVS